MNQLRSLLLLTTFIALVLAGLPGCTTLSAWRGELAQQPPRRKQRKEKVVASFEAQRDAARLTAALNRWNEGNEAACYEQLASLVQGKPHYVDARLQLAELLLYRGQFDEARSQLQAALELEPDRGDLHDCLGRVLEADSKFSEARVHFQKAAELEPMSELYRSQCEGGADCLATDPAVH